MNNNLPLKSIYAMVTRPGEPGEQLANQIQQAGGKAIHLPTMTFSSLVSTTAFQAALKALPQQDWWIFISPKAVEMSWPSLQKYIFPSATSLKLAAIGKKTAQLLQKKTNQIVIFPEKNWSTESLLALAPFQIVQQQKIMLIKGEGGRDTLEHVLTARGALVSTLNVYQRVLPKIDTKKYIRLIKEGKINLIIASSMESIINLKSLLGEIIWPLLTNLPLMVMSERIKLLAEQLGFRTIWVAENGDYIKTLTTINLKEVT